MQYAIFSQEYYTMRMLRKIMAEASFSAVFAGWADNCLSARWLIASAHPSLILMEAELADGSAWDAVSGWNGYGILIYESRADCTPTWDSPRIGKLVKPVSADDLKKILFHLKISGL